MNKISFFLIIILCKVNYVLSQGIFRSSNESSSLLQLKEASNISNSTIQPFLNAASIKLGENAIEYDFIFSTNKGIFLGLKNSAKSNSSIASIFKSGDLVLGYKGNLSAGKVVYFNSKYDLQIRELNKKTEKKIFELNKDPIINKPAIDSLINFQKEHTEIYDGLVVFTNAGLEGRGFYNYNTAQDLNNEIKSQSTTLSKYTFGVNFFSKNLMKTGAVILGASYSIDNTDNFKELLEVTINNTLKSVSPNVNISRSASQIFTAFEGKYFQIKKHIPSIDLYFAPNFLDHKIGFSINYQYNMLKTEDQVSTQDFNLGLYFIEKKNVFNPSFAINFRFLDIKHKQEFAVGKKRFEINVTKQFNLLKNK
ncbi:MAG: hypothetical protein IPP04_06855 [Saprospiraceae bacterium]|nr:hypothetical protein [Saprospiraceae bacterium]